VSANPIEDGMFEVPDTEPTAEHVAMAEAYETTPDYVKYILEQKGINAITKAYMIASNHYSMSEVEAANALAASQLEDQMEPEDWSTQEYDAAFIEDLSKHLNSSRDFHKKGIADGLGKRILKARVDEAWDAYQNGTETLKLVTEADVLERDAPEWWIEGLIQKGTVAVFAGEAGLGKTFTSIHMSRCVATGKDFFGRTAMRGTVLYVVAEGASSFGKRIKAWDSHHHTTAPAGSVNYIEAGVNLSDPASVTRLEATLDTLQPDLIILDTLSQLAAIDNENDAAQMSKVFRTAKALRDHKEGSSVILVHHVNKGAGGVRGSSVIRSNADTVIVAKSGKGSDFYLTTDIAQDGKQKDGAPTKIEGLHLIDHLGSAVVVRTMPDPDPDLEALRVLYADGAEHTKTEARINAGIPKADNSDPAYQKWNRKFKGWSEGAGAILVPGTDAKNFQLLDLVK
jgi:hypothetical protein